MSRKKSLWIKSGRVLDPGDDLDQIADVLIRDGKIASIGRVKKPPVGAEIYDARGKLVVPGLNNETKEAYLLAEKDTELAVSRSGSDVVVAVPDKAFDPIATVVVLEIKGEPEVVQ